MQYLNSEYWNPQAEERSTGIDEMIKENLRKFTKTTEFNNKFFDGELPIDKIETNIGELIEEYCKQTEAYYLWEELKKLQCREYTDFIPTSGGWWRDDGTKVDYPDEEILFYDTETFVKSTWNMPIIATAIGIHNYIWLHPAIFGGTYHPQFLPLGPKVKLTVAHNARFDNSRVLEYTDPERIIYSVDTQSIAKRVIGLSDEQVKFNMKMQKIGVRSKLEEYGTKVGLSSIAKFFNLPQINKDTRDFFVEMESIEEVLPNLPQLIEYAKKDTYTLYSIFKKLYPIYEERINIVSIIAAIIRGSWKVPLSQDWQTWINKSNEAFLEKQNQIKEILCKIADKVYQEWLEFPELVESDIQLSTLDWTPKSEPSDKITVECRVNKYCINGIKTYTITKPSYPTWYYNHLKRINSSSTLTTKPVDYHILCRPYWNGKPVFHTNENKYHTEDGKLPHKKEGANVGSIINQDFQQYLGNKLTFKEPLASDLMELTHSVCYWMSARGRIEQVKYYYHDLTPWTYLDQAPNHTITGRAHSDTWSTVPKEPDPKKIGSEVKSLIQPPPGYKWIAFDQNAQEARIAAALNDAEIGWSCSSPLSWITYTGDKSKGTDIHTISRDAIKESLPDANIHRKGAKNCNYASFYFSGVKTNASTIRTMDPANITMDRAMVASKKMLDTLRGRKVGDRYIGGIASGYFNAILDIINQPNPRTPLLGNMCQPALEPSVVGNDYFTSRANQPIQGAGVDMMDIVTVTTNFMFNLHKLDARMVLSLHDEYGAISTPDDLPQTLFILQIAHMYGWAYLHWKLNIKDFPLASAWAQINVDSVYRTEPDMEIDTEVWNFGVEDGETYSMDRIMELMVNVKN